MKRSIVVEVELCDVCQSMDRGVSYHCHSCDTALCYECMKNGSLTVRVCSEPGHYWSTCFCKNCQINPDVIKTPFFQSCQHLFQLERAQEQTANEFRQQIESLNKLIAVQIEEREAARDTAGT